MYSSCILVNFFYFVGEKIPHFAELDNAANVSLLH